MNLLQEFHVTRIDDTAGSLLEPREYQDLPKHPDSLAKSERMSIKAKIVPVMQVRFKVDNQIVRMQLKKKSEISLGSSVQEGWEMRTNWSST